MRIIVNTNDNHFQMEAEGRVRRVLVVNRFEVPEEQAEAFSERLAAVRAVLAAKPGYVDGAIGRNVDDPLLWVLQTRWVDVGSYRRALSSHDVKVDVVPLVSQAIDEPSVYELFDETGTEGLNRARPRGSLG